MQQKSYLLDLDISAGTYSLFSGDNFFEWDGVEALKRNIPPEIISAAIYTLLESLKEHTLEGHEKATAE